MAKKEIGRPPTAHIPPFGLRLQPELKDRVEAAAKAAGRSLNAEIADRLERSFVDGPDFAMVLADAQHAAALQAIDLEMTRAELVGLADLVESVRQKNPEVIESTLTEKQRALLKETLSFAEGDRLRPRSVDRLMDDVQATRERVREARYRFLEAKGARGARKAQV